MTQTDLVSIFPAESLFTPYLITQYKTDISGTAILSTGMKGSYLGAFTQAEIKIIKQMILKLNKSTENILFLIHDTDLDTGLVNKNDAHLFCGSCDLLNYRVDINSTTKANIVTTVQSFIDMCVENGRRFDLIIIDPPYSKRFDEMYGTQNINHIRSGGEFLEHLVSQCLKILNPNGVLISKNWRSIYPKNSRCLFKCVTRYGGYRRSTTLEAWQYYPKSKRFAFDYDSISQDLLSPWFTGVPNSFSPMEIDQISRYSAKYSGNKICNKRCIISRRSSIPELQSDNTKQYNIVTPEQFIQSNEKYDMIVLDKCEKVGGSISLTNNLKMKLIQSIDQGGVIITKTYFNPTLESNIIKRISQSIISYEDYSEIDLFSVYQKI
jgi:16S rRNA G966 N2-methylase RsmD